MKITQIILCLALAFGAVSCKPKATSSNVQSSVDSTLYSYKLGVDGFQLTDAAFDALTERTKDHPMSTAEQLQYKLAKFVDKQGGENTYYLLDTVGFNMDEGIRTLVIARCGGEVFKAWLVSYNRQGDYIDSRLVYCYGETPERVDYRAEQEDFNHKIHTDFDLMANRFTVSDNRTIGFVEEVQIPVAVLRSGRFDAYPDSLESKERFASCWTKEGMYGKYPLGEDWTAISTNEKGLHVDNLKTTALYTDDLNGVVTLFNGLLSDYSCFLLKGRFDKASIQQVAVDTSAISDKAIEGIVRRDISRVDDDSYSITRIDSFQVNGSSCYMVWCNIEASYRDNNPFLIGVANDKAQLLFSPCTYEAHLFKVKDTFYLFASQSSCDEGAAVTDMVYEVNGTTFKKVFERFTQGD